LGAQLALFALVVQMAVSFGHMHRDDLGLPPIPEASQTNVAAADHAPPPAVPDHQTPADDYCPICASMVLIATAIPSLPPTVVPPKPISFVWSTPVPAHAAAANFALSFHARGPPAA
jgi:hypothetical protein